MHCTTDCEEPPDQFYEDDGDYDARCDETASRLYDDDGVDAGAAGVSGHPERLTARGDDVRMGVIVCMWYRD